MSKKKSKKHIVKVKTLKTNILPYALANISNSLYKASANYTEMNTIPLVNYYLYLSSVEKGLKSAILYKDPLLKEKLKNKQEIGHDVVKLYEEFCKHYKSDLFDDDDLSILKEVNALYKKKGFEYFENMSKHAMTGYSEVPDISAIKKISTRVQVFLKASKYFL